MTCAAILSLEECLDTQRHREVRQRLHDRVEYWLDRGEAQMRAPHLPLAERPQAVLALRQELTQAVPEGLVAQVHRATVEQRTAVCTQGGQRLGARGPGKRTVETVVGAIRRRRPYFDCERCQLGTTPLDEALQLTERHQPPDVQQAVVKLTKEGP